MATYAIAANGDDGRGNSFTAGSTAEVIGNVGSQNHLWFRFAGITADQGATCASAYITFNVSNAGSGTVNTAFYGVDEDNHTAPTTQAEWDTDHGIHTTAKVDYDFSTGISVGNVITSPSLATIFDEIFARAGWATGNAVGIHWEDDGSAGFKYRYIAMREHATYGEAVLTLTLNAGGGGLSIPVASHSYRQRRV